MAEFNKLSQRQQNILIFMDRFLVENGFPPTIREIGEATNIKSTSVVNYNLNKLVSAGFLERVESRSRGLRLTRPIPGGYNQNTRPVKTQLANEILAIPLWGQIVASEPASVPDDSRDYDEVVEVPASMVSGVNPSEVYALRVKGDSMVDAMIQDGDTVIMRKTSTPLNGDMVAVWLTDRSETTLKYFFKEHDRIRLQPAHPTMDPIYVDPQFCEVQGKVLSVMRRLR